MWPLLASLVIALAADAPPAQTQTAPAAQAPGPQAAPDLRPQPIVGTAGALDGDTLMIGGTRIRIYGLDARELKEPGGIEARAAMDALIAGKQVSCAPTGFDRYKRTVAVCSVDGKDLTETMIRDGMGLAYRLYTHAAAADPALAAKYDGAERAAIAAKVGVWARPAAFASPIAAPDTRPILERYQTLATGILAVIAAFLGGTAVILTGRLGFLGATKAAEINAQHNRDVRHDEMVALGIIVYRALDEFSTRLSLLRHYIPETNLLRREDILRSLKRGELGVPAALNLDWKDLARLGGGAASAILAATEQMRHFENSASFYETVIEHGGTEDDLNRHLSWLSFDIQRCEDVIELAKSALPHESRGPANKTAS